MAFHAAHRQAEIGERSAVDVFVLGLLDEFIATSLEFAGEGDVLGCVGDGRDLPLGGLADPPQAPCVLEIAS